MSSTKPSDEPSQNTLLSLLHTCISQNQLTELEYILQNAITSTKRIPQSRPKIVLKVTGVATLDAAAATTADAVENTITIAPNEQPQSLLYIEDPQAPFEEPLPSPDHPKLGSETPLHYAAFYGNLEAFSMLLTYGARLGVLNRYGESPTHLAAIYGRASIISHLIAKRKWKSLLRVTGNTKHNVMHLGALCGREAVIKMISEEIVRQAGAGKEVPLGGLLTQVDESGETPLHICVRRGDINCVQYMLQALLAVHEHNTKEQGQEMDASADAASNNAPLAGLLDADQRTLLHIATMHDKLPVAKLLLQVDPSLLNAQDSRGWTALHMACMLSLDKTEKFLKSLGASPEIANLRGLTSRQFASLPTLEEEHRKFMAEIGGNLEQFELEISGR